MQTKDKNYLLLIAIHIIIGSMTYYVPFFSTIFFYVFLGLSMYLVIKTQNKNNEVIYISAYIIGAEVFFRMIRASPSYEFGKYGIIFFMFLGMFYSGISKKATVFWFYLICIIPGLVLGAIVLDSQTEVRKIIIFNISGPICLGIASLYCYNRKLNLNEIANLLLIMGLPIISCITYLFFYTPKLDDVLFGTGSNTSLSGGFGANQVATILGLGIFIFVSRLIFDSKNKIILLVNSILVLYISYRGFLTFSRGGIITGVLMIITLILYIYFRSNTKVKFKIHYILFFLGIVMFVVWTFTSFKTGGLIDKRYSNQDKFGRKKADLTTGRGDIAEVELNSFYDNPILGIGVGKGQEYRKEKLGFQVNSHDEITRTLSEHGTFGILMLIILFLTPIILFFRNLNHIYLIPFYLFWFLTINHAAMRTAAPAFFYALTLIKIKKPDET